MSTIADPRELFADSRFDNRFTRELPADPETRNFRRQVPGACYSRVQPTTVAAPRLVAWSREVAELLGLSTADCQSGAFTEVFAGNRVLAAMDPHATSYGGHQFGNWAGQLGDGRAINLGDLINGRGERWTLQLKGAGPTPYSRTADGLAVLRSSVREFLCSEAMHHLGVPTTRALSLVSTGELVERDMFYDGHPKDEPGAVVCRVAPSFTRFGHFQLFAARGEVELLRQFAEYTLSTDFPHLGKPDTAALLRMFEEVCTRTADMIVHWMRVGFVHGVMNTDNMSILGLTIDYGPYGWLEDFDPDWTPNTTDAGGRRYRYIHQPAIAQWNLVQLANALYPLIEQVEPLQEAVTMYASRYEQGWRTMMADKLGLEAFQPPHDEALVRELLEILQPVETDMTLFFRGLADMPCAAGCDDDPQSAGLPAAIEAAWYDREQVTPEHRDRVGAWLRDYATRVQRDGTSDEARRAAMNRVNPRYVLRNYLAQLAIDDAEKGDYAMVNELLDVLRHPYDEQPDKAKFAEKRPDWARQRAGCSMLSCSS